MTFHLGIFITVCLLALMCEGSGADAAVRRKTVIIVITLLLGTILALRSWWMADLIKYHTQYINVSGYSFVDLVKDDLINIGLRLFFIIEYRLTGGNFQIVIIIESYFCMSCLSYIIYKYSPHPIWSYFSYITVGLFFFNFSGLKQSIAMSFLMLSFDAIMEKKPLKFGFFVLMAGMFHAPAFIGVIAYYFANWKITRNYFLTLAITFVIVLIFRSQILDVLNEMYYEETELIDASGVGGKFLMMLVLLIGGALIRPPVNEDYIYAKVYNLMVIATLVQSFSVFGHNFTRLADYYFQFIVLYLPLIMEYHNDESVGVQTATPYLSFSRNSFVLVGIVLLILGFLYYRSYIRTDISGVLNYKFFWEVSQTPWGS